MTPSRRSFLMGAAALSAAVATPEAVRAAAALDAAADWAPTGLWRPGTWRATSPAAP